MWLEPPLGADSCGSESLSMEPLYYRVLLSLFSLLTRCVDGGGEGGAAGSDGELTKAARVLLHRVLTVGNINF